MDRRDFLKTISLGLTAAVLPEFSCVVASKSQARRPNVLFIYVDDMGYADPSCFGNKQLKTENIDSLARDGLKFTQYYSNSPICSPSRVAVTTGQYPSRWRIHSYLNNRKANRDRDMADFLDPKAPTLARQLKANGYVTAHFGKWHMGGGRDVDDAPHPSAYGFDESSVTFEGLGNRLLIKNDDLSKQSAALGQGEITWVEKYEISRIRVDQTLDFIKRNVDKPFYVNFWLNDVHDPHLPSAEQLKDFEHASENHYIREFFAVLEEADRQIGRLLKGISELGLDENTLIVFSSDNGPTDWPFYYQEGLLPPGGAGPFRGRKWSLYEGGIRMPFIVRWKNVIPSGTVDDTTTACAIDLFPTICKITESPLPPGAKLDGNDISQAFMGNPIKRQTPIFWYYPNTPKPGNAQFVSPTLAVRKDNWKLLCNPDGSSVQLYNLAKDIGETINLACVDTETADQLQKQLLEWYKSL